MSGAREEILGRIRTALRDVPAAERAADVSVARDYRRHGDQPAPALTDRDDQPASALTDRLVERLRDYHADVRRVALAEVGQAVADCCAELGLRRVVVPEALPRQWRPGGLDVFEDAGLDAAALDEVDAAVTGCAVAIAETGTLVLDGQGASGRRVITLVPDHHICIVTEDQVVGLVPEAIAALAPAVAERRVPVTLISGPSASSDIELKRVEGVHGPRHLIVLIARG